MIYTNGSYAIGFGIAFTLWTVSEFIGPVRWSRVKKGQRRDRGSIILGSIAGVTGVLLSLLFPLLFPDINMPSIAFFAGIALVLLGIGWRWYAILTLGNYFTATIIIQKQQTVVQHGPYRVVRHPSYVGVLLLIAGFGCMIGNWASLLAITAGLFFPLLYRMRVEEQVLLTAFPEEYAKYMLRTKWRIIPFVF